MSQKAYTYATTKDAGHPARQLLLYVIAEHVNSETGETFCKIRTLMRETKIKSDKTVRTHLKRLETDGLIRRRKRKREDGGWTSDTIELVGFLDWATRSGVEAAPPPVKITGGVGKQKKLPDPSGNVLTGGSGNMLTGPYDQSLKQGLVTDYPHQRANASAGTDGASAPLERFTPAVLEELGVLGVNVENLLERYAERTKGRVIRDPSAYLLQMGRDEAAKRFGVTAKEIQATTSRSRSERINAATDACRAFSKPSDAALHDARKCVHLPEILSLLSARTFPTQEACDAALRGEVINARFRPPGRTLLGNASIDNPQLQLTEKAKC